MKRLETSIDCFILICSAFNVLHANSHSYVHQKKKIIIISYLVHVYVIIYIYLLFKSHLSFIL